MLTVCVVVIGVLFVWCSGGYVGGLCNQDDELNERLKIGRRHDFLQLEICVVSST